MTPDEIRGMPIGPASDYLGDIAKLLREIAAQLAEANQRKTKAEPATHSRRKQPREMTSMMRRNGKRFYNHSWMTNVPEDTMNLFTPHEGQKWPSELEVNESSVGTCGTLKDVKITRTQ